MSTDLERPGAGRSTPDPLQRTARIAGVLYLLTFVSIPTLAVYRQARAQDFVLTTGDDTGLLFAALSEVVVALAGIGTAVVLYPVAKRQSETAALGLVTSRVLEGALIVVGVVNVLTLITLRQDAAGTDPAVLVTSVRSLTAAYDWTFLLSQSLSPAFNALFLGWVLYRSGLVPRILPTIGLLGAPLLVASDIAIFFGAYDRVAPVAVVAALPIAAWEFALGIYLTVKGFRPTALAALPGSAVIHPVPAR